MIKLLIVDDSALMRRQLMTCFRPRRDFEIRQARNGDEAVREIAGIRAGCCDVGHQHAGDGWIDRAFPHHGREARLAVVMVSSLTNEGASGHVRGSESGRRGLHLQAWRNYFAFHRPDQPKNLWRRCAAPHGHEARKGKDCHRRGGCAAHAGGAPRSRSLFLRWPQPGSTRAMGCW
jgi:hypothetical protein